MDSKSSVFLIRKVRLPKTLVTGNTGKNEENTPTKPSEYSSYKFGVSESRREPTLDQMQLPQL